jgi:hypothetical protein
MEAVAWAMEMGTAWETALGKLMEMPKGTETKLRGLAPLDWRPPGRAIAVGWPEP